MDAYMLVQTQIGQSREVAREIGRLEGVVYAEPITGPYDVVARVRGRDMFSLNGTTLAAIQEIPGVTRTVTCPISSVPELTTAATAATSA
ncbi:MAG: Lrp/AsnC ligand binding domain-containing protein [Actinomycetota bacterium]|nr:Lrp/AsnC ligand binding domain-containing protein [Actinomycetota bacterium]